MSQLSKPKEFWTNWMSMHDNLDDAKDNWPKAEWEDLRCYVAYEDYESQRAVIEKLVEALKLIEKAYPTSGERMAHQDYARKTLAEMGLNDV